MDKKEANEMIELALKQRMEYMQKMCVGIVAQADMYSVQELSSFLDTIFKAADESAEIMKQSLRLSPDKDFENLLDAQDKLALAVLLDALAMRPDEKRIAAEYRIKECAAINQRLKAALEEEVEDLTGDNLFDAMRNSDEIARIKRLYSQA